MTEATEFTDKLLADLNEARQLAMRLNEGGKKLEAKLVAANKLIAELGGAGELGNLFNDPPEAGEVSEAEVEAALKAPYGDEENWDAGIGAKILAQPRERENMADAILAARRVQPKLDVPSPDVAGMDETAKTPRYSFYPQLGRDGGVMETPDGAWVAYEDYAAVATALSRHTPPKQDDASTIFDADDIKELERMVPDLNAVLTQNPLHKVYFRAGLLACREYMARFVEQGGNPAVAQSIRANWWPSLGDDPGNPRQLAFDEVVEEVEAPDGKVSYPSRPMDPSVEALPIALVFIGQAPEPVAQVRPSPQGYEWTSDRDDLGRKVRAAWVAWAKTQPNPKASWLVPYDELSEADKEADRQIGEALTIELAELAEGLEKWGDEQYARAETAEASLASARADGIREVENMHERAWAHEAERGSLDKAEWHRDAATAIRALINKDARAVD